MDIFHKFHVIQRDMISNNLFFENARLFYKNAWYFKDILREFEAFLK
jgi:hypothetical protein